MSARLRFRSAPSVFTVPDAFLDSVGANRWPVSSLNYGETIQKAILVHPAVKHQPSDLRYRWYRWLKSLLSMAPKVVFYSLRVVLNSPEVARTAECRGTLLKIVSCTQSAAKNGVMLLVRPVAHCVRRHPARPADTWSLESSRIQHSFRKTHPMKFGYRRMSALRIFDVRQEASACLAWKI